MKQFKYLSSSNDKTIKIWNINSGQCEQTLKGHSSSVYCSIEIQDSLLISGSYDSTLRVWNLKDKGNVLNAKRVIQNSNYAWCMTLVNTNELASSSEKNINVYSFDTNKDEYNLIKTLKGHSSYVRDLKMMKNLKELLISCSDDSEIKLWNVAIGALLKNFSGHSSSVCSLIVLSDEILMSAGANGEILVWNTNIEEKIHCLEKNLLQNKNVLCLHQVSESMIVCSGYQDKIYTFIFNK